MKDWTAIVQKEYVGVEWPPRNGEQSVHKFLRTHFGDNDIFEEYTKRRWIIIRAAGEDGLDKIYFRDEADAIWFNLAWKLR